MHIRALAAIVPAAPGILAILCALLPCFGTAAAAQPPPPGQRTPPADFAAYLRSAHRSIRTNLVESARKMPESEYAFRPTGSAEEVRTFGEFVAHLTDTNYNFCSWAKGERRPGAAVTGKSAAMTKDQLIAALEAALAYCDPIYEQATDASLMEKVKQVGPMTGELPRASSLVGNLAHNNEHYGNLVTYLRIKGIVPPSTERVRQPRR